MLDFIVAAAAGSMEGQYRDVQGRLYRMDAESGLRRRMERLGASFDGSWEQFFAAAGRPRTCAGPERHRGTALPRQRRSGGEASRAAPAATQAWPPRSTPAPSCCATPPSTIPPSSIAPRIRCIQISSPRSPTSTPFFPARATGVAGLHLDRRRRSQSRRRAYLPSRQERGETPALAHAHSRRAGGCRRQPLRRRLVRLGDAGGGQRLAGVPAQLPRLIGYGDAFM